MCRYAFYSYKPHLVCFDCRKMFRRRLLADIKSGQKDSIEAKCPQCSGLMASMGLDFKAPPKKDVKAWKYVQNLYAVGITFHSCGCSGPGYIPKNKEEILANLEQSKEQYIGHLRFWTTIEFPDTKSEFEKLYQDQSWLLNSVSIKELQADYGKRLTIKTEAVLYWTNKVNDIDKYIVLTQRQE